MYTMMVYENFMADKSRKLVKFGFFVIMQVSFLHMIVCTLCGIFSMKFSN